MNINKKIFFMSSFFTTLIMYAYLLIIDYFKDASNYRSIFFVTISVWLSILIGSLLIKDELSKTKLFLIYILTWEIMPIFISIFDCFFGEGHQGLMFIHVILYAFHLWNTFMIFILLVWWISFIIVKFLTNRFLKIK